eukprot:tig00000383_g24682.t1
MHPVILDVTNEQHVRELPVKVAAIAGGGRIGLVNNAGWSLVGPLETMPFEELKRMVDVNVLGVMAVTQELLPQLRESKGRVVYAATKFAVEGLADALRREVAPLGVRVSVVEPGWTRSGLVNAEYVSFSWRQAIARSPEPYHDALRRSLAFCARSEAGAADPRLVAGAVLEALASPEPFLRKAVGPGAAAPRLLACLPAAWADAVLAAGAASVEPASD